MEMEIYVQDKKNKTLEIILTVTEKNYFGGTNNFTNNHTTYKVKVTVN